MARNPARRSTRPAGKPPVSDESVAAEGANASLLPSKRDPRAVLVTGAAGALAIRVIERLHARGVPVVAVDFRRQPTLPDGVPAYKVDMHKRGFEEVFAEHAIGTVIHIGRVFAHEQTAMSRYNANVLGTKRLFELCLKHGVRQVLVHSTYFVYGASAYNPALLDEDHPLKASEVTMDLVDSVELESLAAIYLWKHPELHITILRPCNVLGPGVRNSMSLLLSRMIAPVLMGFSPLMQFLHVDDMADALVLAWEGNRPGIYNVAPNDYVPYQRAVAECGCRALPIPGIPPALPRLMSGLLNWNAFFPPYLINYFKYPVVLDGRLFAKTFGFVPKRSASDVFAYYRGLKG